MHSLSWIYDPLYFWRYFTSLKLFVVCISHLLKIIAKQWVNVKITKTIVIVVTYVSSELQMQQPIWQNGSLWVGRLISLTHSTYVESGELTSPIVLFLFHWYSCNSCHQSWSPASWWAHESAFWGFLTVADGSSRCLSRPPRWSRMALFLSPETSAGSQRRGFWAEMQFLDSGSWMFGWGCRAYKF